MKKILIPSILVATILVGGVLAYAIWQKVPVSAKDYYASGKKAYDQKKYSEAAIQLQNSLQKDPKNRDARYYLALSLLEQRDFKAAYKQLTNLLEFYPDDIPAMIPKANILLMAGSTNSDHFREAAEIAKTILTKEPKNVMGLVLAGNAAAGLQDYRTSVDEFQKAVAEDPQNVAATVSLGTSQAMLKNYKEAEEAFLKARQANPKDKNALMSLGNFYRAINQPDKADNIYKEALALYPADRDVYAPVVEFHYRAGRFPNVETILKAAQAARKVDPSPSIMLANLYISVDRKADARALLFEIKKQFPADLNVALNLAAFLMTSSSSELDRAQAEVDKILETDPKNVAGQLLKGQLQFMNGKYDDAAATLEKDPQVTATLPQANFILGEVSLVKGNLDQAQTHFQKAVDMSGAYVPARIGLADVLMRKNRPQDARLETQKVLAVQPAFVPALLLKANLDAMEKKYADADRGFSELAKAHPDGALIHLQTGLYYETRGRSAEAEKSLLRAVELQPESRENLQSLVAFYSRAKQTDRALQKINDVPDGKKQAYHYEMLGVVYAQAGKLKEAEEALKKAIERDPTGTNAQSMLASQYVQTGRLDDGIRQLDEILKKNPNNAGAHAGKGMIYEKQGKMEEAKQSYTQALKIDSNNEVSANNLACMLADQGQDLSTALSWAQMLRRKQPENPNTADTLGWVYYKMGNPLLARDLLVFATSKAPQVGVFQYHLGMIYKQNKQNAEAQIALRKAVADPQDFKEKPLAQAALKEIAGLK